MKITVLGSAGSEVPGHNPPAFLIDDFMLLDAGTVSLSLEPEAQCRITHIFLTHAHLDHIKAIPFLVDNIVAANHMCQLTILSGKAVISDLKRNIFNNRIWPNFGVIPSADLPVMLYREISTRGSIEAGPYRVFAVKVDHSVPAYGYIVKDREGKALVYTGDTGPTEAIWKRMKGCDVKALIIEVSFPNDMEDLARTSGHLTPALLEAEIRKMAVHPDVIYITHLKPYYKDKIVEELNRIGGAPIRLLQDGMQFTI